MQVLIFFLFVTTGYAKGIKAEWKCPESSASKLVNLYFDDQGKLKLNPDVLEEKYKGVSNLDIRLCLSGFQKKIKQATASFKTSECPSSKDDFCYASLDYLDTKIREKLNSSSLSRENTVLLPSSSSEAITQTTNPESFLESKIISKEIDPKNLSHEFSFGNKRYKLGDFDKIVADNIKNVLLNLSPAESRQYAQNYMLMNSKVLNNENQSPKRTAVLNNLNKMFGFIYGEKGAEELAKILECNPDDELIPIKKILENLEDSKIVKKCNPLQKGMHKVFSKEQKSFYSTGNYLLRRDPNGIYKITLNVDFRPGSGSVSPTEMLQRSKACLALASEAMKGPNGEKMTIEVLSPSETQNLPANMRPKNNQVTIESPGYGTNSGGYAENEDCPTIIHEMFHLLGLCDEYQEDRPEYEHLAWKCRVATKAPSIMRDLAVFEQAVGTAVTCDCSGETCKSIMTGDNEALKSLYINQTFYDLTDYKFRNYYCRETSLPEEKILTLENSANNIVLNQLQSQGNKFEVESRFVTNISTEPFHRILRSKIVCTCPDGDDKCERQKSQFLKNISKASPKKSCPMGAAWKHGDRGTLPKGTHYSDETITLVSNPEIPSLLQPNHFYKILEGNCPGGKSQPYKECAEFAYKKPPCNVPAKCNKDSYYLGSPK